MGVANKYNKMKKFDFVIPDDYKYTSLKDLYKRDGAGHVYPVNALYINKKSEYGDAPIVATDEFLVNLPSHLLDTVLEMMSDEELVNAVNSGKFGFTIYTYQNKNTRNRVAYSVNWVDM